MKCFNILNSLLYSILSNSNQKLLSAGCSNALGIGLYDNSNSYFIIRLWFISVIIIPYTAIYDVKIIRDIMEAFLGFRVYQLMDQIKFRKN